MPEVRKRPGTVMFVGIVLFVFAVIYFVSAVGTGMMTGYVVANPEAENPKAKVDPTDVGGNMLATQRFYLKEIPNYAVSSFGLASLDFVFGIVQLVLGMSILGLKPWARSSTILFAFVKLAYVLGVQTYSAMVIFPAQVRYSQLHPPELPAGGPPIDMAGITQITLYFGLCVVVALQFAAAMLVALPLMTTGTKNAFAGISTEAPPPSSPEARPRSQYAGYDEE